MPTPGVKVGESHSKYRDKIPLKMEAFYYQEKKKGEKKGTLGRAKLEIDPMSPHPLQCFGKPKRKAIPSTLQTFLLKSS